MGQHYPIDWDRSIHFKKKRENDELEVTFVIKRNIKLSFLRRLSSPASLNHSSDDSCLDPWVSLG